MGDLEAYGCRICPYEPLVAKEIVGGKHLTVCWHMDNLKISCVDVNEVKKNDAVAIVRIWRNAWITWEETRITGNVARLINTGGIMHIHERMIQGSSRQLFRGDNRDTRNTRCIENFQHQGQQRAIATQQDTGSVVPLHSRTVIIHWYLKHKGRTDSDIFPNEDSEEAG